MNDRDIIDQMHVVVIGAEHQNTLGVIRSLGEACIPKENIEVLLVGDNIFPKNIISTSRYISAEAVKTVSDREDIVPWLENISDERTKKIVICCSDVAAYEVIRNQEQLKKYFFIPTIAADVYQLMSKKVQDEYALKAGMQVPEGKEVDLTAFAGWTGFPCIIKPLRSIEDESKGDIRVFKNSEELRKSISSIGTSHVQIQTFIDKAMEYQLIGCSLEAGRKIIIPGYTRIIRSQPETNTGYLSYSPIDELQYDQQAVKKFIQSIGYSGLFSMEFLRDKEGKDYFLEINMRNDGNAYCVQSAGVNLPYVWCYYQMFQKLPPVSLSVEDSVYFMPVFYDYRIGIKSVGLFSWLKQFHRAESHAVYNSNDMRPFWTKISNHFLHRG